MGKRKKGKKVVVQGEPKLTAAPMAAPAMVAATKKIKVLAYCDSPTCATGFGTVSRNIFEGLYKTGKYDIEVLGINYWGDPHDFPYKIWPVGTNNERDPYGRQKVLNMIPRMDFDLLFFLQDSFILDFLPTLLPNLKANRQKPFKSILYYPVDSVIKEKWGKNITQADYMVAYSEFGRKETLKVLPYREDITVIPHGVNTKEYFPLPENVIKDFREKYFKQFANHFIITNVNRNQQRKDLPRTISAFKKFRETVPESILYLHMAMKDQGWDLAEVCKAYEMDTTRDVIFPSNFGPNQGYPRDMVNLIYNASDVVVSTTLGEGFGLAWMEALSAKTPIIMPANTMLPEFITEETGYLCKSGGDPSLYTTIQFDNEVIRPLTDVNDLVKVLLDIYNNREEAERRATNGYKWINNSMDWIRHIVPQWVKVFEKAYSEMMQQAQTGIEIIDPSIKKVIASEVF